MFSYAEFPKQVKTAITSFKGRHGFNLVEEREDHYLEYRNTDWVLMFSCDHGIVDIRLQHHSDDKEVRLMDMVKEEFPNSRYLKKVSENIWGCEETVNFQVMVLEAHFPDLDKHYRL